MLLFLALKLKNCLFDFVLGSYFPPGQPSRSPSLIGDVQIYPANSQPSNLQIQPAPTESRGDSDDAKIESKVESCKSDAFIDYIIINY